MRDSQGAVQGYSDVARMWGGQETEARRSERGVGAGRKTVAAKKNSAHPEVKILNPQP